MTRKIKRSLITKLPCYLRENVLNFIEDDTWKIDKKHSRRALRAIKVLPRLHQKMYKILSCNIVPGDITEPNVKCGIKVLRIVSKLLDLCSKLKLLRSITFFKYICNQSRILCIYSIRTQAYKTWEPALCIHQQLHGTLCSLQLKRNLNAMLTVTRDDDNQIVLQSVW